MSNSNFNNGKRHVRDRAYYGGAPNQKKRVKFITPDEEIKPNKLKIKFSIDSIITMCLIYVGWPAGINEGVKILAMLFAFASGWSYWKED